MSCGTSLHYSFGCLPTFGKSPSVIYSIFTCSRWMIGEAHDYEYPDEYPIGIQHSNVSAIVLEVALAWLLFYYFIILPCNLMVCNKASLSEYDDNKLKPRLPCFKNFRQYENLHMLFWIAKDLAWNRLNLTLWLICLVPTLLIAADFIWISSRTPTDVRVSHSFSLFLIEFVGFNGRHCSLHGDINVGGWKFCMGFCKLLY